ncbi:MAG TPA: hypothetical protein VHL77_07775 [Ferruginibacter sp.]|nr:hypothetical protein [Ferruginibacter sp.]
MKKGRKIYSVSQLVSAVIMILALMWLTVSTPYVLAAQQQVLKKDKTEKTTPLSGSEEETTNTPGNNTEEKTPGSNTFSEEYIHDNNKTEQFYFVTQQYQKTENAGTYTAFHGELLVPPPNAA